MSKHFLILVPVAAAALALAAGSALAESQYGAGTGNITAQANVKLKVTVPQLILLSVGSAGATQDELVWTSSWSVATAPTAPTNGNNQAATWDGSAPTATVSASPAGLAVYAWTNAAGGGSLSYAATAFGANGPVLGDISVASTGVAHPAPTTLATASTTPVTFGANAVQTGTWTYSLSNTNAAAWAAGEYNSTVTYTATSL